MTEERTTGRTFGARLRAEREAREISLEEIARVTKISIHLLHAMENDDWAALPGGIFTRNFIRLYANHLGLDAERWVEEFKHYGKGRKPGEEEKEKEKEKETKVEIDRPGAHEPPQGWLYVLLIITIALLVGGYFVISYLRGATPTETDAPIANEEPASEIAEGEIALPPAVDTGGVIEDPRTEPVAPLTVTLTETGDRSCWLMIWADSQLVSPAEGENLAPRTPRVISAQQSVRLNIARLGTVDLQVNGAKVQWSTYRAEPRTNAEGTIVSYVVNITAPGTP